MLFITIILVTGILSLIYAFYYLKEYIRYFTLIVKLPGPKTYLILGNIPDILCDDGKSTQLLKRIIL